jgi:hypothetical protein
MILEYHLQIDWKHSVAIEKDNTAYALIKNGEFVLNGKRMAYMVLRLLTIIKKVLL